jgi:hypothetical protein
MIIALYSSVPQSGKSEVARHLLLRYSFDRLKVADPIYEMIGALSCHVFSDADSERQYLFGDKKESPWPVINVSTRVMMQKIGTDLFRKTIDPDFWLKILVERIRQLEAQHDRYSESPRIVIDDCRFENEFRWLADNGAIIIRIVRPDTYYVNNHPSEGLLDDCEFDYEIMNDGSLDELRGRVDEIMSEVLR